MMTKEKSPARNMLKYLTMLPISLALLLVLNCSENNVDGLQDVINPVIPRQSETVLPDTSAALPDSSSDTVINREEDPRTLSSTSDTSNRETFSELAATASGNEAGQQAPPPPPPPPPPASQSNTLNEPVFLFVENEAMFQGGNIENFRQWIQENIVYPSEAIEKNIAGRVTVQFIVTSTGTISNINVLMGVDPLLDNETIRVIESSPDWQPASQGGIPVAQQFTMPVIFSLMAGQ